MDHIFISYSHKDTEYAHALSDRLQSMGFPVWIDARIDYGSQWPHEIQKQLDSCDAFILIMSPRSFASDWVQSELQRAKRKAKPVFPLLLEGDEPWLSVESIQYYDVRNRRLPDDEFYTDLKHASSVEQTHGVDSQIRGPTPKSEPAKHSRSPLRAVSISAATVGFITIVGVCLVMGVLMLRRSDVSGAPSFVPTGADVITAQATPPLEITQSTASLLPVQLPDGAEVTMTYPGGNKLRYTVLSAQREPLSPDKHLLRLRIRVWTDFVGGALFVTNSFRLAAGDLRLAPLNSFSEYVARDETMDGDVEFEIDSSLTEAVLVITAGGYSDSWATKELRLIFP